MVVSNQNNNPVDNLVTATFCGVFLLALWKLRKHKNDEEASVGETIQHHASPVTQDSTPESPESDSSIPKFPRNHSCFGLRDCFGDVIYGSTMYASGMHNDQAVGDRIPTPGSVMHVEMDSIEQDDKWEVLEEQE